MRQSKNSLDRLVFTTQPKEIDKPFKNIIEDYIKENKNKTVYDYFHKKMSMFPEELEKAKNNDETWAIFMPKYFFCYFLILNKNFYRQHIRRVFLQCIEDKQYRLESRLTPGKVRNEKYELISEDEEMEIYQEELNYVNKNLETKFSFGIIVEMVRN